MVVSLALLTTACGQRGPLYLPKDAAAKNRATLPDLMTPRMPGGASTAPASTDTPPAPAPEARPTPGPAR